MPAIRRLSIAQQTAEHLREGLRHGRWREGLPGVRKLAVELGVSHDSVRAALRLLEAEGQLKAPTHGRRREAIAGQTAARVLRVGILTQIRLTDQNAEMQRTLVQLQHDIEASQHICVFAGKVMEELGDDVERLAKLVAQTRVDAWIVVAASGGVLRWFAESGIPCIAFGGPRLDLPIAGTALDFAQPLREAMRRLFALEHRRIVFIFPQQWRHSPSRILTAYLEELTAHGIQPTEYNMPEWHETPDGLNELLESLFRVTPPTALIIMEPPRVTATLHYLNRRRLRVPHEVSVICLGQDGMLDWCRPPLVHLRYDLSQPKQRIIKWLNAVARGNADHEMVMFRAELTQGGSIGPASK